LGFFPGIKARLISSKTCQLRTSTLYHYQPDLQTPHFSLLKLSTNFSPLKLSTNLYSTPDFPQEIRRKSERIRRNQKKTWMTASLGAGDTAPFFYSSKNTGHFEDFR
jgi:hypothetical protein